MSELKVIEISCSASTLIIGNKSKKEIHHTKLSDGQSLQKKERGFKRYRSRTNDDCMGMKLFENNTYQRVLS